MQVRVIVDIKIYNINKPYSYNVPQHYEEFIEEGMRVIVPFGNRKIMGFVVKIDKLDNSIDLKDIINILDTIPCISKEMIKLSHDIKKQTNSMYQSIFLSMIPSALKVKYTRKISIVDSSMLSCKLKKKFKKNTMIFGKEFDSHLKEIKNLIKLKYLKEELVIEEKVKYKYLKYIKLIKDVDLYEFKNKKAQYRVLEYMDIRKDVKKADLIKDISVSSSIIKKLIEEKYLFEYKIEVYRDLDLNNVENKKIVLTQNQKRIADQIKEQVGYNVNLIHGVTGSGKTEVYLDLIDECEKLNKTSIMLVPEISLTPQMVKRFKSRFKDKVAILHSNLSMGEKFDEFRKIQRKEASIVVGARSAIFAPLENLGVIIIDEEHDSAYKQDNNPKYNTIEIAKLRAIYNDCKVVLGSATPQIETYYNSLNDDYNLFEINERPFNAKLPNIDIIDLKNDISDSRLISNKLKNKIIDRYNKGQQIILVLNRRGYANFVLCRDCGDTVGCPNCDISLTYYSSKNSLKCNYCGYETKKINFCPTCNGDNIIEMGVGTEQLEDEVKKLITGIKILRMDSDTTNKKGSHRKILDKFENKEADILIGTQMIAKGLDFSNVTLVGIISADMQLGLPDYKSAEKTYQLLSQASGRAGRSNLEGDVIIQTYNENHYSIKCVKEHDYKKFYSEEIEFRKIAMYPPFVAMSQIVVTCEQKDLLVKESNKIACKLKENLSLIEVIGPIAPKFFRIKNKYRMQIIVKYNKEYSLSGIFEKLIMNYNNTKIYITIDNNPNFI